MPRQADCRSNQLPATRLTRRRLFLEPLESRSLLAIDLGITLTITDDAFGPSQPGNAIANGVNLNLGDDYLLVAQVDDLRTAPANPGVLQAYLDLTFPAFAGTPGAVVFNSLIFPSGQQAGTVAAGELTEVGAGGNNTSVDPTWLFLVPFTANTAGSIAFQADLDTATTSILNLADDVLPGEFTVTNDTIVVLPNLNAISNPAAVNEDAAAFSVNLTGIDGGVAGVEAVTASAANPSLISTSVVYTPGDATGSILVTPSLNAFGTTTVTVSVTVNGAVQQQTFDVTINAVNDVPVVTPVGGTANYIENVADVPVVIDGTFTVADVDSAHFNAGSLTVTPNGNVTLDDRIEIANGNGINVTGNQISFNGNVIGTMTGGDGTTPLMVSFTTTDATLAAVQQLLRNITFRTISATPSILSRTYDFAVSDGAGGTSALVSRTISVTATNDAPELTLSAETVAYAEDGPAAIIVAAPVVTDVDSADFSGGTLTVAIANGEATDVLAIRNEGTQPEEISVAGNVVSYGGTAIGTFVGGNGSNLVITFNTSATPTAVQALVGNITFSSTSQNPSVTNRTITFTLVDGDGSANGGSDTATQGKVVEVFAINDSPLLTLSNEVVTATENQPAVIIAGTSTLTDVDSADFNGGMLFISVTNSELNETLAIRTEGTNAGQINTDGANVRVGTTVIGTFTGGVNEPLQIDFTSAAADLAAVQALLRNITLQVTGDSPTATPREINFLLNDNLGGLVDQTKSVAVVPVNDQPVLTISGGPATFLENSQPVLVAATSTLTDADLGDFNGGTLTVDFQTNGTADDRLELIEQGTAAGEIGLAGSNVTFGGTIFGTLNGGIGLTPLVFTFNTDSSAAAVQALLRRISLENISDAPSPLPRTIRFTFVDGTGGGALTATGTTTANITAVNDPPALNLSTETATFTEGGAAVLIANATTVADSDSIDFAGGTLTASITANNTVDDRLEIRDEGTGAGQINLLAGNVRLGTTVIGSFTGGDGTTPLQITLDAGATPASVQALIRNITFRNVSNNPGTTRTVQVTLNDGDGTANGGISVVSRTKSLTMVGVNNAPVLTLAGTPLAYTEGTAAAVIDATAVTTDVDSVNYDTGSLTVAFQTNGTADDRLGIRNEGSTTGLIGVSGSNVTFGGTTIGTFTGGIGTTNLVVTFNSAATVAATQALLRNITYQNVSTTPSVLPRTVRFTLVDGDGTANGGASTTTADKTINVTAVNSAPVVTLASIETRPTFTENGLPVLVDATATVTDADSADFNGGTLTVSLGETNNSPLVDAIAIRRSVDDRLEIRNEGTGAGQIGVNGSNVTFGGTTIGAFTGGSNLIPLVITLNAAATPVTTTALLRNLTYRNISDNVEPIFRSIVVVLVDGDGTANGGGDTSTRSRLIDVVAVNDPPVQTLSTETVTYTEGQAAAAIISATGTVTDVDSADFGSGTLTVSLTVNVSGDDRLEIRNQGTAAGQIGVSGTNVTFGGTTIGTFTGGSGSTPLVITFNTSATPSAVQTLTQNITFRNVSTSPSVAARTVSFVLNDGDGGSASDTDTKQITVVATNSAPVITLSTEAVSYTENGTAVIVVASPTVVDSDSTDFNTGVLTVSISANGSADDRLTIRNQGSASGQIGVNGSNITFGGTIIGTFAGGTGTTPLAITLNAAATAANTQSLLQNIQFANVSENPTTEARTFSVTLADGDGGTSQAVTKSFAVSAVNDAPANTVPGAQAVSINTNRVFSTANSNRISIADLDAGTVQVTLTATNGTLSLAGITGLTFSQGSGTNDATMVFTGTVANANSALDGLTFTPTSGFAGTASLSIATSDLGNTGSGGTLTDTDSVTISVGNSLSGSAYIDTNGNGTRQTGELGIPNLTVTIVGLDAGNSNVTRTTTTDANGNFSFNSLPIGRFQLTQTENTNFATAGTLVTEVTTTAGQDTTGVSFRSSGIRPELITINHFLASTPSTSSLIAALSPANGQPLRLARAASPVVRTTLPVTGTPSAPRTLAVAQARQAVQAATTNWLAAAGTASMAVREKLADVQVQVADLPDDMLALAQAGLITFDIDAAGQGWFVDSTPDTNEEYFRQLGQLTAQDGAAVERVDLLTVAAHELGHLLGLEDRSAATAEHDLLAESLLPGVRKEVDASILDALLGR